MEASTFFPSLIACDLDGTLLHSDGNAGYGTLSKTAINAVQAYQSAGGTFMIATGNPPEVVMPIAKKLGCDSGYNICSDGDIVLRNGIKVRERLRPSRELQRILPMIRKKFPTLGLALTTLSGKHRRSYASPNFEGFYRDMCLQTMTMEEYEKQIASIRENIESVTMEKPEELFNLKPETLEQSFMALMFVPGMEGETLQEEVVPLMDESFTLLPSDYGMRLTINSNNSNVDNNIFAPVTSTIVFEAPESNKQGALQWVCEQMNLEKENVAAFGDGGNDNRMLKWAGKSFCPKNADNETKQFANVVLPITNDEEAIPNTILDLFLSNDHHITIQYFDDNDHANIITADYTLHDVRFRMARDGVALITLDSPNNLNAMSGNLVAELRLCLAYCERNDHIKCIVWTGSGRAFCSGADLKGGKQMFVPKKALEFLDVKTREENLGNDNSSVWRRKMPDPLSRPWGLRATVLDFLMARKPIICAVNGLAVGGGANYSLFFSDLIYCSENGRFMWPFSKLGIST